MKLTAERLRSLYQYNPDTGLFTYINQVARVFNGQVAGTYDSNGYVLVSVDDKQYLAHRLAYLFMTNEWPPKGFVIDHIDRNPSNNSWGNLRLVTQQQNCFNSSIRSDNTSGAKGVSFRKDRNKFRAYITVGGKQLTLGNYESFEDAVSAVDKARQELHLID